MEIAESLAHHKATPNVSVEDHVRRKRIDLANGMEQAKKVYLDTKFWLLLRDARLGRTGDTHVIALLDLLQRLVALERVVCPISATTFMEVFAQTDSTTLQTSVQLIDDLSNGVSLIEERERFRLEFFHFLIQKSQGQTAVLPLHALVWTKLAYVLGFVTPVSTELPPEVSLVLQKSFVDHMWTVSLAEMLKLRQLGKTIDSSPREFQDISAKLNDGKAGSLNEHSSLKQVFLSEVAGILDVYKPDLGSLMRHLYEQNTGQSAVGKSPEDGQLFANLIYHAFRLNKLTTELPSLRVSASLHAGQRWDKQRKYKRNDLHDFHHATAAIPYCDYFLTEHSLRQLVGQKALKLTELFPCQTVSDAEESLRTLSVLAG